MAIMDQANRWALTLVTVLSCLNSLVVSTTPAPVICTSKECNELETLFTKNMDPVNHKPCANFYDYSCANFLKTAVIPKGYPIAGLQMDLRLKRLGVLKELLEEAISQKGGYEEKMKNFFMSCKSFAQQRNQGSTYDLEEYTKSDSDEWPTLNPSWDEATDYPGLTELVAKYEGDGRYTKVLFGYKLLGPKHASTDTYLLNMEQPDLLLLKEQLAQRRNHTVLMAYQQYYEDLAVALGADMTRAKDDAKTFVNLMVELGKIQMTRADLGAPKYWNKTSTLREMQIDYPVINWTLAVQEIFKTATPTNWPTISKEQKVNVQAENYFRGLGAVISNARKRDIQNMFGFFHAVKVTKDATDTIYNITKIFQLATGTPEVPEIYQCAALTDRLYNVGMAKLMATKTFTRSAQDFMKTMIREVKGAAIKLIKKSWMEKVSQGHAINKINNMTEHVGIPDQEFDIVDLDRQYQNFPAVNVNPDKFNEYRIKAETELMNNQLADLNHLIKKWKWTTSITEINAGHSYRLNKIYFSLGILQKPIFHENYPNWYNYATIGSIVGHAVGRAFDTRGSKFDEDGNFVRSWYTSNDDKTFHNNEKCITNQFNRFYDPDLNRYIDGSKNINKQLANDVGLELAYVAYRDHLVQHADLVLSSSIPQDVKKLFWISHAQLMCMKEDPDILAANVNKGHMPGRHRLIGPLQNSDSFKNDFQCNDRDFMVMKPRCNLF